MIRGFRYSLLIVEDELTTRRLLTYLLEPYYHVHCAGNGKEAKKWLNAGNKADLIITDIEMPIMNGLEFIKLMESKPRYRKIPVMVMSSLSTSSKEFKLIADRVKVFLKKPIEPKILFWRIEQLLAEKVTL
ncbi:response regulator [Roseivirga sp.]|uniref:response regulator n=1 Tax=Roseivirga sp. TaxID=1964215 RepID=UPI003B8E4C50